MKISDLKQLVDDSTNIVCLIGLSCLKETGYPNYRNEADAYAIEQKYGYSPEEIYSAGFFATRNHLFYKFYREFMLQSTGNPPGPTYYALAELEKKGKLKAIITRSVYGLGKKAGCKNVIQLHGSVDDNHCPKCKKKFPVEYILDYQGEVPKCDACMTAIRPGVLLIGETINISDTSRAAKVISEADMLMVVGTHLHSYLAEKFLKYYEGNKLVLINDENHYSDTLANYFMYGKPADILPEIV